MNETIKFLFWVVFHVALAQTMKITPIVSTAHAVLTAGVGVFYAMRSRRHPEKLVYLILYIAASEVLWRMTKAQVFWEYAKYLVSALLALALLIRGVKKPFVPFIYFILFLPSLLVIPYESLNLNIARQEISQSLSGPCALFLSVLFFSNIKLSIKAFSKMLLCHLIPLMGVVSIAAFKSLEQKEHFRYATESSFIGSGGFGPNQVSAVLGFGALVAYIFVTFNKENRFLKILMYLIGVALAAQAALTFSRGGIYCAAFAAFLFTLFTINNHRTRMRIFISAIFLLLTINFVAWPALVKFTGGSIEKRFRETSTTNRNLIMEDDLKIWHLHILMGVGPGQAGRNRQSEELLKMAIRETDIIASHSEFTRALAEHGLFGLISVLLMVFMGARFMRKAQNDRQRAWTAAMLGWAYLHMIVYATRIVAAPLTFGLAALFFIDTPILPKPFPGKKKMEIQHPI